MDPEDNPINQWKAIYSFLLFSSELRHRTRFRELLLHCISGAFAGESAPIRDDRGFLEAKLEVGELEEGELVEATFIPLLQYLEEQAASMVPGLEYGDYQAVVKGLVYPLVDSPGQDIFQFFDNLRHTFAHPGERRLDLEALGQREFSRRFRSGTAMFKLIKYMVPKGTMYRWMAAWNEAALKWCTEEGAEYSLDLMQLFELYN